MGKPWTQGQGKPSVGPPCVLSYPPPEPSRQCGIPGQGDKRRGSCLALRASCYPAPSVRGRGRSWGRSLSAQPHLSRETFPAAEALPVHNVCTGLQLPFVIELVRNVQDGGVRPGRQEEKGRATPGARLLLLPLRDPTPPARGSHTPPSCPPAHCTADSCSYGFCC